MSQKTETPDDRSSGITIVCSVLMLEQPNTARRAARFESLLYRKQTVDEPLSGGPGG
jgi:hypothetical protein